MADSDVVSRRTSFIVTAACGLWSCLALAAAAQQNELRPMPARLQPTQATPLADPENTGAVVTPASQPISKQIAVAYTLSKTASTVDEYSSIIETCERVLAEQPNEQTVTYVKQLAAWSYNRRGEAYAQQAADLIEKGQERKANEMDSLALDDFQASITHDKNKWKAYHNRGVTFGLHGKFDEAIADFDEALRLKPDHVNGYYNRAEIYANLGKFQAAVDDYSRALQHKIDDHGSLIGRAAARRQLGKFNEALQDISQALQYKPDFAPAYCERAEIEMSLSQWQQAAEDYRTAARIDSNLGRAFRGVAWLMATCPELKFRNGKLAVEAAEKAIELDGEGDYRTLDVYAAALANVGQFKEAQVAVQRAIQLAPADVQAPLKSRLKLYASEQPYREGVQQAAAPRNLPR
jgi:tetratricopeptide (TPR) repeat protein